MMQRLVLGLLVSVFCLSSGVFPKGYQTVYFTYIDNIKAKLTFPKGATNVPVIIYNPDDFINWSSERAAKASGYDLGKWMSFFRERGYAVMIPERRRENIHAVKGAVRYLRAHPRVDKNRIYVISMGNAALTTLLAYDAETKIKKCVLICPEPLDDTGYHSFPQLKKNASKINSKVLIVGSVNDSLWRTKIQESMFKLLDQHGVDVQMKSYYYRKRWFWYPEHVFMDDIMDFLYES